MNALITAAEAALIELKSLHSGIWTIIPCMGPADCPTAAAIAALEVEIARAKRSEIQSSKPWPDSTRKSTCQ